MTPDSLESYLQPRSACLVVAHPDDEILWFSSIVTQVEKVIVCFLPQPVHPKITAGRRAALEGFPLTNLSTLDLDEAAVYDCARWPDPQQTQFGLSLERRVTTGASRCYQENHSRLAQKLGDLLPRFDTVFTHNPWGEYGHEEHVQVYRVVSQLQAKLGFALWFSSYVGSRSHALMVRCLIGANVESMTLNTDAPFAQEVAARYRVNGVWTWSDAYQWPEHESMLRITRDAPPSSRPRTVPLTYLNMDMPHVPLADQSLRGIGRKITNCLRRRPAIDPLNPG